MIDLIAWLRDELQNAHLRAEGLQAMGGPYSPLAPETAQFLREAGEQALAEVKAKRRLLDALEAPVTAENVAEDEGLILAVQIIATAYADRPGYREEWRP